MTDKRDNTDRDDRELDESVRRYFAAAASGTTVPGFEAVFASAEQRLAPRRWPISNLAGVAALGLAAMLTVAVVVPLWQQGPQQPALEELVAELSRTTRWQAPSDRWLPRPTPSYLGIPEFEPLIYEMKEVKSWL